MPDIPAQYTIASVTKSLAAITLIVSLLGYIDYVTGEISIDILYILCICLVTLYTDIILGILCVIEILCAKTTADYYDHIKIGSHLYGWNMLNYVFIYLVVCLLVGKLRMILNK